MSQFRTRAVIWDMDGVIVDSAIPHRDSWKFAWKKQGVDFSDAEFWELFGQRNDRIIRQVLGSSVSEAKIEEITRDKETCFRESVQHDLRALPGAVRLLKILQENGIAAAIGSSAPLENIQVILKGLCIDGFFQAVVYGQEVREGKPSPLIFQTAARKLGAAAASCIVIEDAVAGVTAAKRAGMRCIAVTNTHPAAALGQADLVVDSLEKVDLKVLERLFNMPE